MQTLHERLEALSPTVLRALRRGIEKESLRTRPDGSLATTPHPLALGSALTHPHITTDFSESLIETHRDLTDEQSAMVNAKLVLLLSNHIGDISVLREAMAIARQDV